MEPVSELCGALPQSLPIVTWTALFLAGTAYVTAIRRRRGALTPWSAWRTTSFLAGLGIIGIAVLPNLPGSAGSPVRHHMIAHVLLAMIAPIALVLGAPATLALQALTRAGARHLAVLMRSRLLHGLTHPAAAVILNVGAMFLLYLTPLYATLQGRSVLNFLLHVHFVLAGCLFAWVVASHERGPRQSSFPARLAALGVSAAAHAWLAKLMYARGWPANTGEPLEHVQAAAQLMYYGGDVAELLLAVALFHRWYATRTPRRNLPASVVRQVPARTQFPVPMRTNA